jgi:hypothetical protein
MNWVIWESLKKGHICNDRNVLLGAWQLGPAGEMANDGKDLDGKVVNLTPGAIEKAKERNDRGFRLCYFVW